MSLNNSSQEYVSIGRILDSHGVKGFSKIYLLTDFPERFKKLKEVSLFKENNLIFKLKIEQIRETDKNLLIKFDKFNTPEEVKSYKGCYIKIPSEQKLNLPKDTFYFDDLRGLDVYNKEGNFLGKVTDVYEEPNIILEITKDKKEVMLPFVKEFINEVSLKDKKIIVTPISGMFDEDFELDQ